MSADNRYTYAEAGVSIDAGNALVKAIGPLVKATMRPGADGEIGGFGGFFDPRAAGYSDPLLVQRLAPELAAWLGPERSAQLEASLSDLLGTGVELAGAITAQVAQSGLTVLNTIAVLFITPVVAFYLLLDWEGMVRGLQGLLPRETRAEINQILSDIDKSMAGVIRGQGGVRSGL